jgi:hypothetical protein
MVKRSSVAFSRLSLNSMMTCWLPFHVLAAPANRARSSVMLNAVATARTIWREKEGKMTQPNSSSAHPDLPPVVSLPHALYDSLGLLFELYHGGQPPKHHEISWVRLEPMRSPGRSDS